MNPLRRTLVALTLATAALAQSPVPPSALARTTLLPVHVEDVGERTEVWTAGPTFKASFHDGMSFFPFVGKDLPHQPFAWRTVAVRAGGAPVPLAPLPAPQWTTDRVVYDLGAVHERYDVRREGLEQSFVLPRPLGGGDLTITGRVQTPLWAPPREPMHGPLAFQNHDGRVRVDYGTATAIDARGARLALATSWDGHELTLHVPGTWLAGAHYPVVVDPVISAGGVASQSAPIGAVDLLHETVTPAGLLGRVWIVYSVDVAAGDRDLYLDRHPTGFGSPPTTVFSRISNAVSTDNGSLGLSRGSDRAVLFFDEQNNTGNRYLGWRAHDCADMVFNAFARFLLPPTNLHYWRPDVGGRIDDFGTEIAIVFQFEEGVATFSNTSTSRVAGMNMNPALFPGGNPTTAFTIRWQPTRDQERPSINQASSEPEWLVAMVENDNTTGDAWQIELVTLDGNNNSDDTGLVFEESPVGLRHQQAPQVAGDARRFLVTYTTRPVAGSPSGAGTLGDTVRSQRVDFDPLSAGLLFPTLPHPAATITTYPAPIVAVGGLAHDHLSASHWCVAARVTGSEEYRTAKLGYRGAVVESALVRTAPAGDALTAGGVTFRSDTREFLLGYGENGGGGNDLRVDRVSYDAVAAPTLVGSSCGSASWMGLGELDEKQQIGAQGVTVGITGAAPDTGVALLMISLAPANVPLSLFALGNCDLRVDPLPPNYLTLLVLFPGSDGEGEVSFDLPEELPPTTYYCQWLYVDASADPALEFFTTNRLVLPTAR